MPTELEVLVARLDERLEAFCDRLSSIEKVIEERIVTKAEFGPVKSIAYGLVSAVLLSVLGALVALVINKGN